MIDLRQMQTPFCYNGLFDYVKHITVKNGLEYRDLCMLILVPNLIPSVSMSTVILSRVCL